MITDAQTRFSTAQALTSGTVLSTNGYDLGAARDVGRGKLSIFVNVNTAFAGGTSLQVNVVESANSDGSAATVIMSGPTVADASLTAGANVLDVLLTKTSKRYIYLQYVNTGIHTAGAVDAGIVMDADSGAKFVGNIGF